MCRRLLLTIFSLAPAFGQVAADQTGSDQAGSNQTEPTKHASGTEHTAESQTREIGFGKASSVQFQVRIFGLFKKLGSFTEMQGALTVRKDTVQVNARIKTASTSMQSSSDAALLKSQPYFDAAHFPEIVFQSVSFPIATLRSGGEISGNLTLRGISQPQIFKLTTKACGREFALEPWRCGFNVTGALKRSEFGMKARRGIVSDEVELTLSINGNTN